MTNPSKARGTLWETAIVAYLISSGYVHAERRSLNGALDKGDIAGIPGVVIEAKNEKTITLASYMREVAVETANAKADVGVAWIKRRGKASAADGYVVMTGKQFVELLAAGGWAPARRRSRTT